MNCLIFFSGDDVPPSPFCMTNVVEWDNFRNIDMDKEVLTSIYVSNGMHLLCTKGDIGVIIG